jgi:hypothetical protein
LFRDSVGPLLISRFGDAIREKFEWLLGRDVADDVLARGLTTSNGRVMGRGRGYRLEPHLDSAHMAVTCLLYFSTLDTLEDGGLTLFRPERPPEVLHASTYYPQKSEGIVSSAVRTIAVRENLFVTFLNGPTSLHGFSRAQAGGNTEWRFAYQCHVVPRHFDIAMLAARLAPQHRQRWAAYVNPSDY